MPNDQQETLNYILELAAFGLVMSIWLVALLLLSLRRRRRALEVEERLRTAQPQAEGPGRVLRLWHDGHETTIVVPGIVGKGGPLARFRKMTGAAGLRSNAQTVLASMVASVLLIGGGAWLGTGSAVAALATVIAVLIAWYLYFTHRIGKQRDTFDRQLIDALDLAARSLRVGHPLVASFNLISQEIPAPIGELFGEVCQEQELGVAMDQSLRRAAAEHGSEDMGLFVAAVVTQLRCGGNLADMMERVAAVIRERCRLARRVRLLTAQTQFSKRILLALPFFLFVLLNVLNPTYMSPLMTTAAGQLVLVAAGGSLLCGWMTMNWLSKLTP